MAFARSVAMRAALYGLDHRLGLRPQLVDSYAGLPNGSIVCLWRRTLVEMAEQAFAQSSFFPDRAIVSVCGLLPGQHPLSVDALLRIRLSSRRSCRLMDSFGKDPQSVHAIHRHRLL